MTDAADAPLPLVTVSRAEPPPREGLVLRRGDWGAFRAAEVGSEDVLLLRPTAAGLRIERAGLFETVPWDAVTGVALTDVRVGVTKVPVARILFRSGPTLDLADVHSPGADELPMSLEAGGPTLLRVERLRMAVATVIASAGLAPRTREDFHRGGRGVPAPELVARPRRLPRWAPPLLLVLSIATLVVVFPKLSLADVIAIHVALFAHEAGHAIAMRLVKADVRGILFLPALGAATLAEHPFRTRWDDIRVALAGPVTGLPMAAAAVWLFGTEAPAYVRWGLVVGVLWNLLNLIPLVPMDGGRILVATVAGLPRLARALCAWAPVTLAAMLVAFLGPRFANLGFALLLAFSIVATRLALRRLDFHQWVLDVPIEPGALRSALRDVTWGFGGSARDDVDGGVPATPMTAIELAKSAGLYVVVVIALGIASVMVWPLIQKTLDGV